MKESSGWSNHLEGFTLEATAHDSLLPYLEEESLSDFFSVPVP